jgi:predicted methyltransferase
MRNICLPGLLALVVAGCGGDTGSGDGSAAVAEDARNAAIQAAIDSPERTDEMRARDAGRKPAEVLALSGISPGDHVIEIGSFGHYYTTLLTAVVGPNGKVDMFDPPASEAFGGEAARAFDAAHDNAEYHQVDYADADFPSDVDVAFNILFYHDHLGMGLDVAALNASLFDALKPGGTYLVIDHKAEDGSGWRDAGTLHRIGAEVIIEEVTAAGFELVTQSDLLAHPDDPRTAGVFSMRGDTDRAVLLFRKPG